MAKNSFNEFNDAMNAMDWERAIRIGDGLAEWLGKMPGMDPKLEAFVHLNLGLAYSQVGEGDVYIDDTDRMCWLECSHSADHLRTAERIAGQYGLEKIAAAADKLMWHFDEDPLVPYIEISRSTTEPMPTHSRA